MEEIRRDKGAVIEERMRRERERATWDLSEVMTFYAVPRETPNGNSVLFICFPANLCREPRMKGANSIDTFLISCVCAL